MEKRILVAYASVSGSTGEVAEAVGEVIDQDPDVNVDVCHVRDVVDIEQYGALVLGSSIRAGRWLPEAFNFLKTHQAELQHIPVAYFTTCLTMVSDTQDSRQTVLDYMEPVQKAAPQIKPVGLGLFAGALDPTRQPIMPSGHTVQGDYRNWDAIRAWAAEIRPRLLVEVTPAEPLSLSEAVLCYTDMSGLDLSNADLVQADLREANLSEADLHEADLSGARLTKTDIRKGKLHQASLSWAEMHAADLREADLSQANLIGASLDRADLGRANLSYTTLNGANLSYADLNHADLSYADLNWADLRGADLSYANLSRANLGWANLSNANLDQVNLNQASYNDQTQWPPDFSPEAHGGVIIRVEPH
ncbi:MAG: pentapeptide repeat-containing protein [Anaerolineales bacterium]|nr:pentapeptide repeat-containing protein [Anaerolineales bacterium]